MCSKEALHKGAGGRPENRVTFEDEFLAKRRSGMAFPDSRFAHGDDVDRLVEETARLEPFDLQLKSRREALEITGAKGLLQGKS